MKINFRMASNLLQRIHNDLSRPHSYAYERVGFISCGVADLPGKGLIILGENYHPVADKNYIDDNHYGAMMNSEAIRDAMQYSYHHSLSMFHIHRHEHNGLPRFSGIDLKESFKFIPDFWNVQPNLPHGILVLSHDSIAGLCWIPQENRPTHIAGFSFVKQTSGHHRWIA